MEEQRDVEISKNIYKCGCDNCMFVSNAVINFLRTIEHEKKCLSNVEAVSIIIDHVAEHTSVFKILIRITISSDSSNTVIQYVVKTAKRNLPETFESEIALQKFRNEIMFYTIFARRFISTICVRGYILDSTVFSVPLLIIRDLTGEGYTQVKTKLSKADLKRCIKALACLHANGIKLVNENVGLAVQYHDNSNQVPAISFFLNSSLIKIFGNYLEGKIKQKLNKGQEDLLNKNDAVLVHGSLTRSKIFFKETDNEAVKFIDFETMSLGSPAIDFGRLLFTNLPNERNATRLEKFCRDILNRYVSMFMTEYKTFGRSRLYQNIINNLVYSYVNLDETEKKEIINHVTLVTVLDNLGSLD